MSEHDEWSFKRHSSDAATLLRRPNGFGPEPTGFGSAGSQNMTNRKRKSIPSFLASSGLTSSFQLAHVCRGVTPLATHLVSRCCGFPAKQHKSTDRPNSTTCSIWVANRESEEKATQKIIQGTPTMRFLFSTRHVSKDKYPSGELWTQSCPWPPAPSWVILVQT